MMRSRYSLLTELLLLGGVCVALLIWVIPAQTSEGGFGLSPAFLPTMLTVALLALVLCDGALRLLAKRDEPAYPAGFDALARILGVAVIGALALRFGGVVLAGAVTSAAGLLALGELRPLPVLVTTLVSGGALWLVFG
jgi:hypothetical protein